MVKYLYDGNPIYALVTSGIAFLIAAILTFRIDDVDEPVKA
jgi:maltose/moltooligosaccharide transporter